MSKAVQKLFTDIAPNYDSLNRWMSFSIDKRWRDKTLKSLQGHPCQNILDLCAGTLDLSQKLGEEFPQAKITALDFSLAMLQQGQEKIRHAKNIQLICADGHQIPLPDHSFDTIVCGFGIRNLEDRVQAAKEIRRVLTKGGKLLVLEFFRPKKFFPKLFYQTYGKYVIPRLGSFLAKNREAYEYLQNSIMNFLSIEEYEALLHQVGFEKVQSKSLSGGIVYQVLAE